MKQIIAKFEFIKISVADAPSATHIHVQLLHAESDLESMVCASSYQEIPVKNYDPILMIKFPTIHEPKQFYLRVIFVRRIEDEFNGISYRSLMFDDIPFYSSFQ